MDILSVRPKPVVLKNYAAEDQLKFELWFLLAPLVFFYNFFFFFNTSMYISLKMQEVARILHL